MDGVDDCGAGAAYAQFAETLAAERAAVGIVLRQKHGLYRTDVRVDCNVVAGEVLVDVRAVALIDEVLFHQRRADTPDHASDHLRAGSLRIENMAGSKYAKHPADAHLTGIAMHCRFGEVRAKTGMRIARAELGGRDGALRFRNASGERGLEFATGCTNGRTRSCRAPRAARAVG